MPYNYIPLLYIYIFANMQRFTTAIKQSHVHNTAIQPYAAHFCVFNLRAILMDKEFEQYLHSSDFIQMFHDTFPGTIFILNEAGQITYWNQNLEDVFHVSDLTPAERNAITFVHPDDREFCMARMMDVFVHGSQETEFRFINHKGQPIYQKVSALRVVIDGKPHIIGYGMDIDQFRHNRELLENKQQLLEADIARRDQNILYTDTLLKAVNTCAHILLMATSANFNSDMQRTLSILGTATNADRAYIWKNTMHNNVLSAFPLFEWTKKKGGEQAECSETGQPLTYSTDLPNWLRAFTTGKGIDGLVADMQGPESRLLQSRQAISIMVRPIFQHNALWGFIGFDDCINARNWSYSEEELLQTSGMLLSASIDRQQFLEELQNAKTLAEAGTQAKSQFLSTMSHELRTPMNAILGFTQLFDQEDLSQRQRNYLDKIKTASAGLLHIINDILDMSKIEARKFIIEKTPFNLHEALHDTWGILSVASAEKGLDMQLVLDPAVPAFVEGDAMRLNQVLINLLSNAVKFTAHGSVCLEVRPVSPKDSLLPANQMTLYFSVLDTGIGLSQEQQKKIFTPFSQGDSTVSRKFGGTGLGLSISKQLVELMGGTLHVQSNPDKGAHFFFTMPFTVLEEPQKIVQQKSQSIAHTFKKTLSILVVEDNDINQELACAFIEVLGMQADVAENGAIALAMLAQKPYDIVFMDMQMPVMDGLEATKQIRANPAYTGLPIVAMTANAMQEDRQRCLSAGMDDHLPKPLDLHDIENALLRWVKP